MFFRKRTDLLSPYVNYSNCNSLSEHRHTQESARATTLLIELTLGKLVYFRHKVMDMNRLPVDYSSAWNRASAHNRICASARWNSPIMGYEPNHITIKAADKSVVCLTQPCGTLRNDIQHRLKIGRRARNHAQDFACGSLLLQRLPKFLEQPNVLKSNNRLVCEGFQELDLSRSEGTHLGTPCAQRSN